MRERIHLNRVFLDVSCDVSGDRWGHGTIPLHFQMRSFLVLTENRASVKQAGNPAF